MKTIVKTTLIVVMAALLCGALVACTREDYCSVCGNYTELHKQEINTVAGKQKVWMCDDCYAKFNKNN